MTTICAHPICQLEIPAGRLACRSHWFALPTTLRARIWATYQGRHDDAPATLQAHQAAVLEAGRVWARALEAQP